MTELMIKMTFWLLASMLLGFIVAWFLSQKIYKKRYAEKEDALSALVLERNNMVDKLEKNFRKEKRSSKQISDELENSKQMLNEKTSLLTTLQHKLNNLTNDKTESLALKEKNKFLQVKMKELEKLDSKRLKELEGFEEIVSLAESKLEQNEKKYKKILKKLNNDIEVLTLANKTDKENILAYKKIIINFEKELSLYKTDTTGVEFIISKDQFLKIEEQLEIYKKEIEFLKNEKNKVLGKFKTSPNGVVSELQKESDDGLMVKAFRETYKKITSS